MVDSAFSEWDKAAMFNDLQQANSHAIDEAGTAEIGLNSLSLKANFDLLLSLSIIPTLSGVALVV